MVVLAAEAALLRADDGGFRLRGWWRRSQLATELRSWGWASAVGRLEVFSAG